LFNGGVVDFFDEAERFFVACFIAVAFQLPLWFDRLTTNGMLGLGGLTANGISGLDTLTTNVHYSRYLLKRVASKHFRAVRT
jgi:hypothetical protein